MKTSNKLLLAGVILMVGYLIIYDFGLRAEYLKGDFKSRFYKMRHVDMDGFNSIANNIGNIAQVQIEQGPKSGIWISERENETIAIVKKDKNISIDFKKGASPNYATVIIVCPTLTKVTVADRTGKDAGYFDGNNTVISGFTTDSLSIIGKGRALIALNSSTIKNFYTKLSNGSVRLSISDDNKIVNGDFNILGDTRFEMRTLVVEKPVYNFGSNAQVQLSGKSFNGIKQ